MRSLQPWHAAIALVLLGAASVWHPSAARAVSSAVSQLANHQAYSHSMHSGHVAAMTPSSFFVLLGAGLLTGFSHCVGMCGPLVGAVATRLGTAHRERSTGLTLYQMGRLTTYVVFGAVSGSMGALATAAVRDWQGLFAIAMALPVIWLALGLAGLFSPQAWLGAVAPARRVSRWVRGWLESGHPAAPFGLGLANGLLPCGPVYSMVALAAMSGSLVRGASLMCIFGLGTFPAMFGCGFSAAWLRVTLRDRLGRVAAVLVLALGVQLALRGLALYGLLPHGTIGGIVLW